MHDTAILQTLSVSELRARSGEWLTSANSNTTDTELRARDDSLSSNTQTLPFALTLPLSHPKLAAKAGHVIIECCECARLIPSFLQPCLRNAHTAFVIAKVCRSPLELTQSAKKICTTLTNIDQIAYPSPIASLMRQSLGLMSNIKDVYNLLTKTQLLTPGKSLKHAIKVMSVIGISAHFGWTLLDVLQQTPEHAKHSTKKQFFIASEAIAQLAIAAILFQQIKRGESGFDTLLPWLSACTLVCGIGKAYESRHANSTNLPPSPHQKNVPATKMPASITKEEKLV